MLAFARKIPLQQIVAVCDATDIPAVAEPETASENRIVDTVLLKFRLRQA
ncbi:hypothetical protein SEHO0A_04599 [Salmonella enterica subsp. houtenae str. ATCC BAA-1581]|nr:hypothetical protein SEHO0A_04599 [Salmonella enterica subsp. houtenae str. ATCC BAA-1581]ENZ84174.1 hypothetical protein D088_790071 [Salmonella enterica subsp. houtenae serovar 16:z4,z32:-- str. RKS3027]